MKPRLLLGLGNPLMGDDGVAWHLLARLRRDPGLPGDVDVAWGGSDLLACQGMFEGRERIVLVDAVEAPGSASPRGATRTVVGEVVELDADGDGLDLRSPGAHALSVPAALALLRRTDPALAAADLRLLGVTVTEVTLGDHLSPAVERRLPEIATEVLAAISER